ncbi:MAG TPA: DUF4412 domain-containing protein [Trichormus sp.]|jgi:hypothetical protein
MTKKALLLALAGIATTCQAFAMSDYPKAYDATYEMTAPGSGVTKTHQMSDGKGHMRIESEARGMKTISIYDYPNNVMYTIMEAQKMYMKMPLKQQGAITDETSAKKANAKSLGAKTIDGHPCHGWESKTGAITSDCWIGDDIHNLVLSETTAPTGKVMMALKSYSAKAPGGDLAAIPPNYKEMKMPGMH